VRHRENHPLSTWALLIVIALWAPAPPVAADPTLGRLFSTPEERARLDEARRLAHLPPAPPTLADTAEARVESPPPPPPAPPPRGSLAVDGYVIRGDGGSTVWVNRESSTGGPLLGVEAVVEPPQRPGVGVHLQAADGTRLLLRPGQSLPEGEAIVREGYLSPAPAATPVPAADGAAVRQGRAAGGRP